MDFRFNDYNPDLAIQNSGASARAARIFSASTIASTRRKSSRLVVLIRR